LTDSADHSISARNVADVHAFLIDLQFNGDHLLFILLSADGSINRIGNGTLKDKNRNMFIGVTDPDIFERVRSHLTEAMLQGLGHSFQCQNIRGAPAQRKPRVCHPNRADGNEEKQAGHGIKRRVETGVRG